ncbi:MAG TPA: O-antigen ligase family protein [Longilinea sp.]|nr:O-antigen ligase family protein [Longilinea sp.]
MFYRLAQSLKVFRTFRFSRTWFEQNQPILIRAAVLLLLLFSVLYAVPRITIGEHLIPRLFVVAIFALAGLVVLLRFPTLVVACIIPATIAIPFGLGTGSQTELPVSVLLVFLALGLWLLDMLVVKKDFYLMPGRPVIAALLLAFGSILSFAFGQLPWFYYQHAPITAQIGGTMLYVLAAGTILVTAHCLTRKVLVWSVVALISLGSVFLFLNPFSSRYYSLTRPILQFFSDGSIGAMFWIWLFCIALAQLMFNNSLTFKWKFVLGLVLVVFVYNAFFERRDWVSGWLPAMLGGGVILFMASKKFRIPLLVFGFLILALNWQQIRGIVMVGDNQYSLMTRLDAWEIMFKIIAINPILGVGPANYYFLTPLFPILGYSVQFNSHNNYIDLLAQTGIIGLGLFIWLMVEIIVLGLRMRKNMSSGFDLAFVYGVIGGMAGTLAAGMLGDWVIPFVYNVGFAGFRSSLIGWFFIGGLLALNRLTNSDGAVQNA